MSTNTTTESKRPGRPPVILSWPDGDFTVEQLEKTTGLSKVTLYQKVKEALLDAAIVPTGKESSKQGRPRTVFQRVETKVAVPA